MKSWVKALLIGLSITFTSLTLLLAFLPSLLKPTLNRWLPDALDSFGISGSSIEIDNFSWRQLDIQSLVVPLPDGSLFALKNLSLSYAPGKLLAGELKTLELDEVVLHLAGETGNKLAGAAAAGAGQAARNVITQTPEIEIPAFKQWLQLPLESVQIHRIDIHHPAIMATLRANITPQLWRIWGDTQLDNIPLPWQLEMQLQSSGDLLVMLSESSQLLTQIQGNIDQNAQGDTHITLSQQVDVKAVNQRLFPDLTEHVPLTSLQQNSELRLPARVRIPQGIELNSQLFISTEPRTLLNNALTGQRIQWQSGELKATVNKVADQPFNIELYSRHQLNAAFDQQAFVIQQLADQPLLSGECVADLTGCTLNGVFSWIIEGERQSAAVQLMPVVNWQQQTGVTAQLNTQLQVVQQNAQWPKGSARTEGEFHFVATTEGNWQLTSEQGLITHIEAKQLSLPKDENEPVQQLTLAPIKLTALKQLAISNDSGEWSFDPLILQLDSFSVELTQSLKSHERNIAQVFMGDNTVSCLPEISDNQKHNRIDMNCQLSLSLLPSSYEQWPVPPMEITGPLMIQVSSAPIHEKPQIDLNGELNLVAANRQFNLRTHIQHHQGQQNQGSLQWQLMDTPLSWSALGISEMTDLTQLQLLSGSVSGQGWLDWTLLQDSLQLKPDFMLRFDDLSATYDNSLSLERWRGLFAIRRPVDFTTDQLGDFIVDAQIAGDSLNSGVQLSNILARSQSRIPQDFSGALIEVYEMHTDVLGGRVHTPLIRFDTNKDINAFGIEVENVQLSELAKLEPNAQIEATGVLDGVLPIVLTPEGPQVPGGNLFARAPGGVIRYNNSTSQALKSSDQTVGLAMQLLEDYRYQKLESGVEYQPDGSLNLALQFQGANPGFFDGQASHLNVNLNYNLLDLLESLRVSSDVIQRVEDKYQ